MLNTELSWDQHDKVWHRLEKGSILPPPVPCTELTLLSPPKIAAMFENAGKQQHPRTHRGHCPPQQCWSAFGALWAACGHKGQPRRGRTCGLHGPVTEGTLKHWQTLWFASFWLKMKKIKKKTSFIDVTLWHLENYWRQHLSLLVS